MTTVSKKQKWFNTIHLTKDDDLYVGIDAHKKSLHVALWPGLPTQEMLTI